MKNSRGILYCAIGKEFYKRSRISAESIRKYNKEICIAVCTDEKFTDDFDWTEVILMTKSTIDHNQYMIDKLRTLLLSPFYYTLYLDSDTYILDDISELFHILEKFDFAVCHGHNRLKRFNLQHGIVPYKGEKRQIVSSAIPYSFAPVQGGLILYKMSGKVKNWLQLLINIYQEKNYFDDQAIIRELLWESKLNFYILPPEYNFNSIRDYNNWIRNKKIAKPKIFHYTKHKNQNIKKLVRRNETINKIISLLNFLVSKNA